MNVERIELEEGICVDCLMIEANGVDADTDPEAAQAFIEASEREAPWFLVSACSEDCEGWFSWSPCGWCRRPLGGDRHPAVELKREEANR